MAQILIIRSKGAKMKKDEIKYVMEKCIQKKIQNIKGCLDCKYANTCRVLAGAIFLSAELKEQR